MNGATIVFLLVLGAAASYLLYGGGRIVWHLIISKRLTNSIKKFERLDPTASQRILFIGDSTGYGTGTSDSRYSIVGRLGADFPNAHIENFSETGVYLSRACRVLKEKLAAPDCEKFNAIIIMLGGMNLVHGTPLPLVRRMLRQAIVRSKQCGQATIIIGPNNTGLAPMYPSLLACLYRKRAKRFDALYREVTQEEGVPCVPLFQEHEDELSARGLFACDKTHPNDEGYGVWYDQMKEVITTVLKNHDGRPTS